MPIFFRKKQEEDQKQVKKSRTPLTLWLFYLGVASMGLTSVTFSRYSTVIHGTISVQVAAEVSAMFLDDDGSPVGTVSVYEGQMISEVPECTPYEYMDEVPLEDGIGTYSLREEAGYKVFMGWSLDGKTVIDPTEIPLYKDTEFIAVYEVIENYEPPVATPSEATPSEVVVESGSAADQSVSVKGNAGISGQGGSAGTETSESGTPENGVDLNGAAQDGTDGKVTGTVTETEDKAGSSGAGDVIDQILSGGSGMQNPTDPGGGANMDPGGGETVSGSGGVQDTSGKADGRQEEISGSGNSSGSSTGTENTEHTSSGSKDHTGSSGNEAGTEKESGSSGSSVEGSKDKESGTSSGDGSVSETGSSSSEKKEESVSHSSSEKEDGKSGSSADKEENLDSSLSSERNEESSGKQ